MSRNIVELFLQLEKERPDKVCMQQLVVQQSNDQFDYQDPKIWTLNSFKNDFLSIADYLKRQGIKPQDSIAIVSNTRPEWLVADFAVMALNAVSVSVYQTLTADEIAYLIYDSRSQIVFAENKTQVDKLIDILDRQINIPAVEDREAQTVQLEIKKIICFDKYHCQHEQVVFFEDLLEEQDCLDSINLGVQNSLASLVYTSGTTGLPKGVMQTHENHLANVRQVLNSGILDKDPALFLFLPMAHSFAKLMAYLGILTNCSLKLPAIYEANATKFNPDFLFKDIKEAGANVIPLVPRVLEKLQDGIIQKSHNSGFSAFLLRVALGSNKLLRLLFAPLVGKVKAKVKAGIFGEELFYIVSGGAKLSVHTNQFFENLDIKVLQGYGLTETCVATNINRLDHNYIGTVGPVLCDDIELKICDDGEIAFRGPNVTPGYWERPQATSESWDSDGWFYTGDLGVTDHNNCLSITGRKKEIIITSYGKKIPPDEIESKLCTSLFIENAVLCGEGKPFLSAVIALDQEQVRKNLNSAQLDFQSPEVLSLISKELDLINNQLASYEQVRKFVISPESFTTENRMLTPTMKVKRALVYEKFFNEISSLYEK